MKYSRSLVTFAFVHDALRVGDIISGLVPLFTQIAASRRGHYFSPKEFAKDLDTLYGIRLHPYVAEDWAARLAESGLLVKVSDAKEYNQYVYADVPLHNADEELNILDGLIENFKSYALELFNSNQLDAPSSQEMEEAFFSNIRFMDFEAILSKPDRPFVINGDNTLRLNLSVQDEDAPGAKLSELLDVCAATFLLDLKQSNPTAFMRIGDIASGALAAEVVLGLRIPPNTGKNFTAKWVFLDSPIVLDALNLGTVEECEFAHLLIDGLRSEGAYICVHTHCVDEIATILKATTANLSRHVELSGAIGTRLLTDPSSAIVARNVLASPESQIKRLGIKIVNSSSADQYKYFSLEREKDLLAKIRPFSTEKIQSREVDASSIASMIRYLVSKRPRGNIMSYDRFFITKNKGLIRAANNFMNRESILSEENDSPIISDRFIAGLLWVAKGGAGSEIALRKLVANCTAAVRPRKDVITKTYSLLRKISPESAVEFEALITDDRCNYYLMKNSLGSADLITENTAPTLLEQIRRATAENVAAEKEAEALARLAKLQDEHDAELEAAKAATDALAEKMNETDQRNRQMQTEIDSIKEYNAFIRDALLNEKKQRLTRDCARMTELLVISDRSVTLAHVAIYAVICVISVLPSVFFSDFPVKYPYMFVIAASICGLLQFGRMPEKLFGSWFDRIKLWWFENSLSRNGLGHYLLEIQPDLKANKVVHPELHDELT